MQNEILDDEARALAQRLARRSAAAWVAEVDRIARVETVTVDEALTLLARRFSGRYLEARRDVVWRMLEYLFLRLEPDAWRAPLRHPMRRGAERRGAAA